VEAYRRDTARFASVLDARPSRGEECTLWRQVISYSLAWRSDKSEGTVPLICQDGTGGRIPFASPRDLEALGSVLRNEKPISYSHTLQALRTGPEPPGEEEASRDVAGVAAV
jgi:hypothetical protein